MQSEEINSDLEALFEKYGESEIRSRITMRGKDRDDVLSILADGGMHRQPDELILGQKYLFSEGMIDTASDDTVSAHILDCCERLSIVLKESNWSEVRLFFSGHSLLPAFAKLTVYRVAHLDTEDFGFFGEAGFRRVSLSLRRHLIAR